ncbi:hypothetical protein [Halobellus ruber]|nr:hypothetical protein [Halobellus ruber]
MTDALDLTRRLRERVEAIERGRQEQELAAFSETVEAPEGGI